MESLFYIIITGLFVWMMYGLVQKDANQESNAEILNRIDHGDKWYYYKMKLKIFGLLVLGALAIFFLWLIVSLFKMIP